MAEIRSGLWIMGLLIYFFALFLIVNTWVDTLHYYSVDSDLEFRDPGFGSGIVTGSIPPTINSSDNADFSSVVESTKIITGIGSSNVDIGIPNDYLWIYNFIFFWIPALILVSAIYFALPFI